MHDQSWNKIFNDNKIFNHNFDLKPYIITSNDIKKSVQDFKSTSEKEVRILCKQDFRESRPEVFKKLGLFLLPVKNGKYVIIKGEGYVDIPEVKEEAIIYRSKLNFKLDSILFGNSEMQHLDYAFAVSIIRTFLNDNSLVLTIRGRKYTPEFSFFIGKNKLEVKSVQTEVDAGYEGSDKIVLIEAKNKSTDNIIIRQLYYPFLHWKNCSKKQVIPLLFTNNNNVYSIWQYEFKEPENYNSINLVKSCKYKIL